MITAYRYHDFSYGHRVAGHENKCASLHGHNGRVHFTVAGERDSLGRVLDFGVIKTLLCEFVENSWDHKFLAWGDDAVMRTIDVSLSANRDVSFDHSKATRSIVWLPFNPTAENMANHLLNVVGPQQLAGTGVRLIKVTVDETRKCSASAQL